MESGKTIHIYDNSPKATIVACSRDLGRLLTRPEVVGIAKDFDRKVIKDLSSTSIDIVPPLSGENLETLGELLVELATALDPTPPKARVTIH
jgi:hypothetical protein